MADGRESFRRGCRSNIRQTAVDVRIDQGYAAYQCSGEEWLGDVPAHWQVRRVRSLAHIVNGATPPSGVPAFWDGDIIWITPADLGANPDRYALASARRITPEGYDACGTSLAPRGSIAVSTRAPIGHLAILGSDACVNQGCRLLVPNGDIASEYLYHCLSTARPLLSSLGQGSTFSELSAHALGGLRVGLPPPREQVAIARYLDHADRRIRRYIRAKERLVELLEERKRALIHEAVTGRIDVRTGQPYPAYKDSGVEWLGKVPEHWELRRVKHAVRTSSKGIQIGPFGSSLTQLRDEDTGYKLYGQEHTISGDFRRGSRWITQEQFRQLRRYELLPNDVVLTRKGSLGKCRLVPRGLKRGIMDSDTIRVRLDPTIVDQEFMVLLLHRATYLRSQIESVQRGAVLWGLNTSTIANLHTALPPIGEQQQIKARIGAFLDRIGSATDAVDRQIALLKEYRTRLIADVVTGKLDVREAAATLPETDPLPRNRDRADTIPAESNLHSTAHDMAKEAIP